jgi:2-keto-4-pentenoate hydratase
LNTTASPSQAAALLLHARRSGNRIAPLPDACRPRTEAEARAIQNEVTRQLGDAIGGWKAALLPDGDFLCAPIFKRLIAQSPARMPAASVPPLAVEAEMAFRLDQPLPPRPAAGFRADDIAGSIGAAMAAIEILDSRYQAAFASPRLDLLADHLGNGAVVVGEAVADWSGFDRANLAVSLDVNGVRVVERAGGNPVGDPLRVVLAFAAHTARHGLAVTPGQIVITGSYTGVHSASPGDRIVARLGNLPVATITFGP